VQLRLWFSFLRSIPYALSAAPTVVLISWDSVLNPTPPGQGSFLGAIKSGSSWDLSAAPAVVLMSPYAPQALSADPSVVLISSDSVMNTTRKLIVHVCLQEWFEDWQRCKWIGI
jgi:uncharacterized membrane protein